MFNTALPPIAVPQDNRGPIAFECEIASLSLKGALPVGLRGTLVRNGPNPLVADAKAHWFTGDGMLHAFEIAEGRVAYRNRWVQTGRLAAERASGQLPAPGSQNQGTANTHVVAHAGRLLALEEAHLPIAMTLPALGTLGPVDFGGAISGPFTAHPKEDPRTGELHFFGYGAPERLSAGMSYGVVSRDGVVTRFGHFEAPYASMVHDFALSEGYVIFPVMPLTGSPARAEAGCPPYAWEPEYGTRVGLLPRGAALDQMVWLQGPVCYVFHVMNAWEEGDMLLMDVMQFDRPPLFPLPSGQPIPGGPSPAWLTRWRFDLKDPTRTFSSERIAPVPGEFPRMDERFAGRRHAHGWYTGTLLDAQGEPRISALMHWLAAQPAQPDLYAAPAGDHFSEPVFVPRAVDAPEGDGWLLATLYRGTTATSDLAIFDAQHLSAGPLCLAALPHRVPDGFHGSWVAPGALAGASVSATEAA